MTTRFSFFFYGQLSFRDFWIAPYYFLFLKYNLKKNKFTFKTVQDISRLTTNSETYFDNTDKLFLQVTRFEN